MTNLRFKPKSRYARRHEEAVVIDYGSEVATPSERDFGQNPSGYGHAALYPRRFGLNVSVSLYAFALASWSKVAWPVSQVANISV
jgi:hypothetical protein